MGVETVWASYPGDSTRTAEARRGDSGEACGKHGDTAIGQGTGGQTCGQTNCAGGAKAVLSSTRFKLVTAFVGAG